MLITGAVGVSLKPLLDLRNVYLVPPLAPSSVAREDIAGPKDSGLPLPVLIRAITLEYAEAVRVRHRIDQRVGLSVAIMGRRADLERPPQVFCKFCVESCWIEQFEVVNVSSWLAVVVGADNDVTASDHHRPDVLGELNQATSGHKG